MGHKNEVKKYLDGLDKEELVSLLQENAENDELLRSRLLLKASRGGKRVHLATFKKVIDDAVGFDSFIDYRSMHQYTKGLDNVIESLTNLRSKAHAIDLIELSEYLLTRMEAQLNSVDDSNGEMGEILNYVQELHHDACVLARPDPEKLAKKLFEWELKGEWEVFYGAVIRYADVLGDKGLKVYAELAEKEWASISALKAGDDKQSDRGNRFRITSIMHQLAEQTGDIEKIVAVKMKDLSFAYSYLQIAELYKKKRNLKKALEWAETGVEAFPVNTDSRLREFLANEYHRLERHDDAMRVAWDNYRDRPTFDGYKILKVHASQSRGGKGVGAVERSSTSIHSGRHCKIKAAITTTAMGVESDRSFGACTNIFMGKKHRRRMGRSADRQLS
jgi:hypothetical protein